MQISGVCKTSEVYMVLALPLKALGNTGDKDQGSILPHQVAPSLLSYRFHH